MTPTTPAVERLAREMAEAIWKANGGVPRLLHEIARFGSNLSQQQELCEKQARSCATIAIREIEAMRERAANEVYEFGREFFDPGTDPGMQALEARIRALPTSAPTPKQEEA